VGVAPGSGDWAESHWWIGYTTAGALVVVIVIQDQRRVRDEGRAQRLSEALGELESLKSENSRLRRRVESFAPASPPSIEAGAPVLRLEPNGYVHDDGVPEVVYALSNWSEFVVTGLAVHSASADVEILDVTPQSLGPAQAEESGCDEVGRNDGLVHSEQAMVTVRWHPKRIRQVGTSSSSSSTGGRSARGWLSRGIAAQEEAVPAGPESWRQPWKACITYTAARTYTNEQELS